MGRQNSVQKNSNNNWKKYTKKAFKKLFSQEANKNFLSRNNLHGNDSTFTFDANLPIGQVESNLFHTPANCVSKNPEPAALPAMIQRQKVDPPSPSPVNEPHEPPTQIGPQIIQAGKNPQHIHLKNPILVRNCVRNSSNMLVLEEPANYGQYKKSSSRNSLLNSDPFLQGESDNKNLRPLQAKMTLNRHNMTQTLPYPENILNLEENLPLKNLSAKLQSHHPAVLKSQTDHLFSETDGTGMGKLFSAATQFLPSPSINISCSNLFNSTKTTNITAENSVINTGAQKIEKEARKRAQTEACAQMNSSKFMASQGDFSQVPSNTPSGLSSNLSHRQYKIINALDWLRSMLPKTEIDFFKCDMSSLLECTVFYRVWGCG